jgi:hypothetical protein
MISEELNYTVRTVEGDIVHKGSLYSCALYRREHINYKDVILDPDGYIVPYLEWSNEILNMIVWLHSL